MMRAYYRRPAVAVLAALVAAGLAAWAFRHYLNLSGYIEDPASSHRYTVVFAVAFALLAWQTVWTYLEPVYDASTVEGWHLDSLNVVVSVPVYNEDPAALRACLTSLVEQSRQPQTVHVVDDGSPIDYTGIRDWFVPFAEALGVHVIWVRQENAGKRHAQGRCVVDTPEADVYVTVDSDAILDYEAIREGLKPFANRKVFSVAGVVLTANHRKNFLTRFTDLWFVVGQLTDRSSLSTLGSVLVNSGSLALYRAEVLRDNLDGYLNETFFGRRVEFSDDSMLTIYALQKGRAVQQPTAYSFTLMPDNLNHHLRQYLRWMRGAFIRSWWRFKYLPLNSYAFWGHLLGWAQMAMSTVVFTSLVLVGGVTNPAAIPWLLLVPVLVGYGQSLRYFTFKRSDETFLQKLAIYMLAPVAALWAYTVLRVVRWYAMATCLRTGWGTRSEVEVGLTAMEPTGYADAPTMLLPTITDDRTQEMERVS